MSRAFVKEEGGERWQPARPRGQYRAYLLRPDGPQVAHEDNDLAALLQWAARREGGAYEVRDASGQRLALVG